MKISEAIARADELRPNAIPDRHKADWLYKLDGELCELMYIEEAQDYQWPEEDTELLMPYPHDDIYPLYLMAMIDNANEETALYQNDMTMFNGSYDSARKWWHRTHKRAPQKRIEVM